jgi:hypothetical protein
MPALPGLRDQSEELRLLERAGPDDPGRPDHPAGPVVRVVELDPPVHEPRRAPLRLKDGLVEHREQIACYRR